MRSSFTTLNARLLGLVALLASIHVSADDRVKMEIQQTGSVVATAGPAVVTTNDFHAYMSRIPESDHKGFLQSPARVEQALVQLLEVRLFMAEAYREGLLSDPLHQALIFQTASVLTAERMAEHYMETHVLDDYTDRARELFLADPQRFNMPERLDFTHLLIRVEPEDDQVAAMKQVLDLHEQLEAGAELDDLAQEYSEDPQLANNQGRYQGVEPKELEGTVRRHIEQLEPGERSQPFPSGFGWHIVRLDARHGGGVAENFEEVRERALRAARNDHRARLRDQLRSRLTGEHETVIPEDAIRELLDHYEVTWSRDHEELVIAD